MDRPSISIVMPSFNQASYIEESIQSILSQNYSNLEILILDGGSTDGSKKIITQYADYISYWHSRPDNGQTPALIDGFNRATGDLLCWVNSDDIIMPNVLERAASIYMNDPNIGILFGDYALIDEFGKILKCKRVPKAGVGWFAKHGYWVFNSTGTLFSKKAFDLVGGLHSELNYVMDADLFMRMLLDGVKYKHIGCYLGGFRRHKEAKTVYGLRKSGDEYLYAAQKYWPSIKIIRKQKRWKIFFWLFQILNGNISMFVDTAFCRSKYWNDCTRLAKKRLLWK